MADIIKAVKEINPNAKLSVNADDINQITWLNGTTPIPKADIEAKMIEVQAVYDSQLYARTRKAKYDLLNQDEMRYDDLINNTTTWRDGIAAIKTAHPKP
jgi:hypothetical protein